MVVADQRFLLGRVSRAGQPNQQKFRVRSLPTRTVFIALPILEDSGEQRDEEEVQVASELVSGIFKRQAPNPRRVAYTLFSFVEPRKDCRKVLLPLALHHCIFFFDIVGLDKALCSVFRYCSRRFRHSGHAFPRRHHSFQRSPGIPGGQALVFR